MLYQNFLEEEFKNLSSKEIDEKVAKKINDILLKQSGKFLNFINSVEKTKYIVLDDAEESNNNQLRKGKYCLQSNNNRS